MRLGFVTCFDIRAYPPLVRLFRELESRKVSFQWTNIPSPQFEGMGPLSVGEGSEVPYAKEKWRRLLSRIYYFVRFLVAHGKHPFDRMIVVDHASATLGLLLHSVIRIPLLLIEFDHPKFVPGLYGKFQEWVYRRLSMAADLVCFPSEARHKLFEASLHLKVPAVILPNFPSKEESLGVTAIPPFKKDSVLILYYQGSFVPSRIPFALIDAMKIFSHCRLKICAVTPDFPGGDEYQREFQSRAESLGLGERIHWLPLSMIEKLSELGAGCHVGVLFFNEKGKDSSNQKSMWGASNKVPQYASFGLALLVSSHEEELRENTKEISQFCDGENPESIAKALEELFNSPERLNEMRRRARELATTKWTYERALQTSSLLQWLGI